MIQNKKLLFVLGFFWAGTASVSFCSQDQYKGDVGLVAQLGGPSNGACVQLSDGSIKRFLNGKRLSEEKYELELRKEKASPEELILIKYSSKSPKIWTTEEWRGLFKSINKKEFELLDNKGFFNGFWDYVDGKMVIIKNGEVVYTTGQFLEQEKEKEKKPSLISEKIKKVSLFLGDLAVALGCQKSIQVEE